MTDSSLEGKDRARGDSFPPPGGAIGSPISGVSLWYNTRQFILHNESSVCVRCEVERALNGHPSVERFSFVVDPHSDSHAVIWLAGKDTGGIRLVDVTPCLLDGALDGRVNNRVEVVYETPVPSDPVASPIPVQLRNYWSVPVYVSVQFGRPGVPDYADVQLILSEHTLSNVVYADFTKPSVRWRAAELQRTNLYGLWPPAV